MPACHDRPQLMLEPHRTTVGRVARWGCGIEGGTSGTGEVVIVVGKSREGHEHGSLEVVVRLHEFDGREVLSPLDGVVDEVVAVAFDAVDEMGEQEDVGKEEESEGGLGTVEVGHRGVARRERGEDDQGQATPHAFAVHALLRAKHRARNRFHLILRSSYCSLSPQRVHVRCAGSPGAHRSPTAPASPQIPFPRHDQHQ